MDSLDAAALIRPAIPRNFTEPLDFPELGTDPLDGILFANSLHFVADPVPVLRSLVARLRPSGRVVIVEYDRRRANRWVPYPIPAMRVAPLAMGAGLTAPTIVATRPSAFGGTLYVAAADRAPAPPRPLLQPGALFCILKARAA